MTLDVKRRSKARRISARPRLDARSTALTAYVFRRNDEASHAVVDDFRDGAAAPRHDRRSTRHGFDHDKTERLRPVDWEEECCGVAAKSRLLAVADLAPQVDPRLAEQGSITSAKYARSTVSIVAAILSLSPVWRWRWRGRIRHPTLRKRAPSDEGSGRGGNFRQAAITFGRECPIPMAPGSAALPIGRNSVSRAAARRVTGSRADRRLPPGAEAVRRPDRPVTAASRRASAGSIKSVLPPALCAAMGPPIARWPRRRWSARLSRPSRAAQAPRRTARRPCGHQHALCNQWCRWPAR
jgi:hypothetical protein